MDKIQVQTELTREKKERIPVWMYPSTLAMIEGALQQANCKSRSEFLEEAAKYYAGYVSAENAIQYLPPMLVSAFRGTVRDSEMHISRLLFKLAVELDMMMNVLASELDTEPEVLAQMRGRCIQNVKNSDHPLNRPRPALRGCVTRHHFRPPDCLHGLVILPSCCLAQSRSQTAQHGVLGLAGAGGLPCVGKRHTGLHTGSGGVLGR